MLSKANALHLMPDAILYPLAETTSRFLAAIRARSYVASFRRAYVHGPEIGKNLLFLKFLFVRRQKKYGFF